MMMSGGTDPGDPMGGAMAVTADDPLRFPLIAPGYWSLDRLLAWHERALSGESAEFALSRHQVRAVLRELTLRGVHTGDLPEFSGADREPGAPPEPTVLKAQWRALPEQKGRIPAPARVTELWAHHKYSMMARNPSRGREIGARRGAQDPDLTVETLLPELVTMLATPPPEPTLRDAVMHMWGYVSPVARDRGLEADYSDIPRLVGRIGEIALEDPSSYLAHSTALCDLALWGNGVARGE